MLKYKMNAVHLTVCSVATTEQKFRTVRQESSNVIRYFGNVNKPEFVIPYWKIWLMYCDSDQECNHIPCGERITYLLHGAESFLWS